MTAFNTANIIEQKQQNNKFLTGLIVGLVLLIVAWLIQIFTKGFQFNFQGIKSIHEEAAVFYLIDFIPLLWLCFFTLLKNNALLK